MILERGDERWRERERNIDVREKHQLAASHTSPNWGLNPQPRDVLLTGNCTYDLLGYRSTLQPTEPHWPGPDLFEVRLKNAGSNYFGYTWELPDDCPNSCLLSQQAQVEPGFSFQFYKSRRQHQWQHQSQHGERCFLSGERVPFLKSSSWGCFDGPEPARGEVNGGWEARERSQPWSAGRVAHIGPYGGAYYGTANHLI